MSINKHITHHLSKQGKALFPQWFEQLQQAAKQTSGFVGVMHGREKGDHQATHVILCFEDKKGLVNWQHNPEHQVLLEALMPYLLKQSSIRFFEFDAAIDTQ
ncbi:MAG: hypothetical protein P1U34_10885 [Coxiellaceae bacterium]|nr:hypothetical protein [Coxiellaceae bacterium]